jgi:phosphoribosyl-AMP cyclohydrolase
MNDDLMSAISWNEDGLVPAIAQDAASGQVLMLAWMNREALAATVAEGRAVYWSRSRQRLWRKGEESGNVGRLRGGLPALRDDRAQARQDVVTHARLPARSRTG